MTALTEAVLAQGTPDGALPPIIGASRVLREAVQLAQRLAVSDLPLLLVAPTGCGKELLAQYIHAWSGRPGGLVDLNCAALPETLLESELFGHAAGAFSGARSAKPGLIEVAHGRSFFLDEVPSLSLSLQAKVLRVVEQQEFRRLGEVSNRRVHVRFIAAAQEDLAARVRQGVFRADLYHRLAGGVVWIAPLVERPADIWVLATHFAARVGRRLDPAAETVLLAYRWPGNVRELRMVIERAACVARGPELSVSAVEEAIIMGMPECRGDVHHDGRGARSPDLSRPLASLRAVLEAAERTAIQRALALAAGHRARAATLLGISEASLYRRLGRLGDLQICEDHSQE
jgi:anaerobic nitric oxide reductase transcription regulator